MKRKLTRIFIYTIQRRRYATDRNYSTMQLEMFEDDLVNVSKATQIEEKELVKPYDEVPGPKQLPIIGNAWRFAPLIGNYERISEKF